MAELIAQGHAVLFVTGATLGQSLVVGEMRVVRVDLRAFLFRSSYNCARIFMQELAFQLPLALTLTEAQKIPCGPAPCMSGVRGKSLSRAQKSGGYKLRWRWGHEEQSGMGGGT